MIKLDKVTFKALRKMTTRDRIQAIRDPQYGQILMSALTPTDLASLFPRYYLRVSPDISGFLKAIPSGVTAERQRQRDQELADAGRPEILPTTPGSGFDKVKKRIQESQTAKIGGREMPQLTPEQSAVIDRIRQGQVSAEDKDAKFLSSLSEKDLKTARIQVVTNEKGEKLYQSIPMQISDEEIITKMKAGEGVALSRYSAAQAAALIRKVGGTPEEARMLGAISQPESTGNPAAHNPKGKDNSYGLFQINLYGKLGPARRKALGLAQDGSEDYKLKDPEFNAKAAIRLYRGQLDGKGGWQHWSTYTSGAYKPHLNMAEPGAIGDVKLPTGAVKPEGPNGTYTKEQMDKFKKDLEEQSNPQTKQFIASKIRDMEQVNEIKTGKPVKVETDYIPPAGDVTQTGYNRFNKTGVQPQEEAQNIINIQTPFGPAKVHKTSAAAYQGFFNDMAAAGAPIKTLGSYAVRQKRAWLGGKGWSEHSFGNAIDIDNTVGWSPEFSKWLKDNPGMFEQIKTKWGMKQGIKGDPNHVEFGGVVSSKARAELEEAKKKKKEIVSKVEISPEQEKVLAQKQYEESITKTPFGQAVLKAREQVKQEQPTPTDTAISAAAPAVTKGTMAPPAPTVQDLTQPPAAPASVSTTPRAPTAATPKGPEAPSTPKGPAAPTTPKSPAAPATPKRESKEDKQTQTPTSASPVTPTNTNAAPAAVTPPSAAPATPTTTTPKIEASVTTAPQIPAKAEGGKVDIKTQEQLVAKPIGGLRGDNTVVVDQASKPVFTMNTDKEAAVYNPVQQKVDIIPTQKNDGRFLDAMSSQVQQSGNMDIKAELNNLADTLREEFKSSKSDQDKQPPNKPPMTVSDRDPDMINQLTHVVGTPYRNPSSQRAFYRARFNETGEPVNDFHHQLNTTSVT